MKIAFLFILIVLSTNISKVKFYNILREGNNIEIDKIHQIIPFSSNTNLSNAYEGALYCRSAEKEKKLENKIENFKLGVNKIEKSIKSEYTNVEIHFLRLLIQENSPSILRYNKNINEDCLYITSNFSKVSDKELKDEIIKYDKISNRLDLKE